VSARLILHEYAQSGNCYKVRLTAALLGLPLERREYDIMKGETRRADFLQNVNANGRIPVLQAGTRFIPESNAACFYLADGSPLVPADRFERADMLRWVNGVRCAPHMAVMSGGHDGLVHSWLGRIAAEPGYLALDA
jgi:glutathione S-transferase